LEGVLVKRVDEMMPVERAEFEARLAADLTQRPEAQEAEIVPLGAPGAICFLGSSYGGVSPSIGDIWPMAERWLSCFLDLLPYKHRLAYWKERIDCGATLLTLFVNPHDWRVTGAGIINCELADDGTPVVFAPAMTFNELDLADLSKIAECIALVTGAQSVHLWTPKEAPIVAGYHAEKCWFGQLQVAPVRPIQ
jgi:hypothetical protein